MPTAKKTSHLIIVESPTKAKTISRYLGPDYKVIASVGHVRDLPKNNKKAIDVAHGFTPHYEIVKGKEDVVKEIRQEVKKASQVILATDPDREGEAIAWHIAEICGIPQPQRIVFHEITEEAVKEALQHPRTIDEQLRRAQEARRVLDRLFGYDLSGLIWRKLRYGLSAGRVQSPALRILVEREKEIRAFIPETYWIITALLRTKDGQNIKFTCEEEPRDLERVKKIITQGKSGVWHIIDVKETVVSQSPRAPFTTSTLQQSANTRLGWSTSKTMSVAQRLYEAGLITYMRTDSPTISKDAQKKILSFVEKKFGQKEASARQYKTKSKTAQEAHEAIRPTDPYNEKAGASPDQKKLYALIHSRTIASQMADAKIARTKIVASTGMAGFPPFSAHGSRILSSGWMKADPYISTENTVLPKMKKKETLTLEKIQEEEKQTSPPRRYTEAGLVKELEKRGIGRPSTYATIIKTLHERGYITKDGRTLIPTDTGEVVSDFLEKNFTRYVSDSFTAEMEENLDKIASGEKEYEKTLLDFYLPFKKEIEKKRKCRKNYDTR